MYYIDGIAIGPQPLQDYLSPFFRAPNSNCVCIEKQKRLFTAKAMMSHFTFCPILPNLICKVQGILYEQDTLSACMHWAVKVKSLIRIYCDIVQNKIKIGTGWIREVWESYSWDLR